jgi:peptidyl-prolyl cis-trans isomerase B (cyclophilin B)
MKKLTTLLLALLLTPLLGACSDQEQATTATTAQTEAGNPRVLMQTSMGDIVLELYPQQAPVTVTNFLRYVDDGFYDGTIFHRVIDGFMIQGGGFTQDFEKKGTRPPIINEADNGLRNKIGTVAMARTQEPHSATAQFFINVANNTSLDFREKTPRAWGYAVFGRVVKGMEVVKAIKGVATTSRGMFRDVPATNIVIKKVSRLSEATTPTKE